MRVGDDECQKKDERHEQDPRGDGSIMPILVWLHQPKKKAKNHHHAQRPEFYKKDKRKEEIERERQTSATINEDLINSFFRIFFPI